MCPFQKPNLPAQRLHFLSHLLCLALYTFVQNCCSFPEQSLIGSPGTYPRWRSTLGVLLGRISSSEFDPQSFLLCLGLFCTFVYVRMYVSGCTAHVCIRVCAQPPHALAKCTKALGCNPLLPSPKSVRLWGVHRHRTGWRLVGVPFRSTHQTV